MGYPDRIHSRWYVPLPAIALVVGVVLGIVLPAILMIRGGR